MATGVTSAEHGLAATRERHRGDGFVQSALPPRAGSGVAAAPVAEAGAGEGAGAGSGEDTVADLGMEAMEGPGVVVAAAGVTVDSSAEDRIDPLGPVDPLGPIDPIDPLGPKRRPREQTRGGEEELSEKSVDAGAKTLEDHGWENEKGLDGGGRGGDGGGGGGGGSGMGDAGVDVRTGSGLSGEEGAKEAPVDTEGGATTPPADKRAPRIGEERAHKMWVTMGGGATVLGESGNSRRILPKAGNVGGEKTYRSVLQVNHSFVFLCV